MMKMIISWNSLDIIEIVRKGDKYYSVILPDNASKAVEDGMPLVSIASIKLASKRMPQFILDRIPKKEVRDNFIDNVSEDEGENIINYINKTNCKYATDKFMVRIQQ